MSFFERYLSLWVALCIVAGIALGHLMPAVFQTVGRLEIAQVNLPVGFDSGAALVTVVGVLVEVPVMLSVVKIVNNTRGWYKRTGKEEGAVA
jgi:ACR3 family arsenite efflux pump ArsB